MKRLFSLLTAFVLAAALCAPVMADDVTTPDVTAPTPTPTAAIDTTSSDGVYVSAYSVTDTAGGEVTTVQVGDKINIVLKVVDHASARYCVKPEEISARINSAVFTYTGHRRDRPAVRQQRRPQRHPPAERPQRLGLAGGGCGERAV